MKKFLKKLKTIALSAALALFSSISVLAAETETISVESFNPVLDAMKVQINVTTILAVLVVVISASIGIVFMWWGVRKVIYALMAAFKKGKLKV